MSGVEEEEDNLQFLERIICENLDGKSLRGYKLEFALCKSEFGGFAFQLARLCFYGLQNLYHNPIHDDAHQCGPCSQCADAECAREEMQLGGPLDENHLNGSICK